MPINKHEQIDQKLFIDPKAFVEYSNNINNVYKKIDDYNPNKKQNILIVFDDMTVAMLRIKRPV